MRHLPLLVGSTVAKADPPVAGGTPLPYRMLGVPHGVMATDQITWDGAALALAYAVPNGPRVCVVKGPSCRSFLPNAAAVVPSNPISDGAGSYLFDPRTGQYITTN